MKKSNANGDESPLENRYLHLHIGRHKTGTTSFQNFLHENVSALNEAGVGLFKSQISLDESSGPLISWAHEIPLVSLRREFDYALKMLTQDRNLDLPQMVATIETNLMSKTPHLVASHEALSFVRNRSELLELKRMTEIAKRNVRVYLVLREQTSWKESYKRHFESLFEPVPHQDSFGYLERGSWLFDDDSLISVYEDVFGKGSVTLINYETSLRDHGDTCVALLDSMNLPLRPRILKKSQWLNVTKKDAHPSEPTADS